MVGVSWAVAAGGSIHTTTESRGSEASIQFDSVTPAIRTAVPSLPFADAPAGADSCSLPYAAAAIMWAALVSNDDGLCAGNSILVNVLSPDAITRVLNQLEAMKFDFAKIRHPGQMVHDLEQFVVMNPHEHFELKDADLVPISAAVVASCAPASLQFVEQITLLHVRKPSKSMSRMALLESWMAPRLLRDERYASLGQCLRFMRSLNTHARQTDADIRAEIAETSPDTSLIEVMVIESIAHRIQNPLAPPGARV